MEAIIFCGIQATGKTTYYGRQFLKTHLRISLDMLNTRNKERKFLDLCLQTGQRFVIDNTNPTCEDRRKYIELAKSRKFRVIGYYFQSEFADAVSRNALRQGKENIPEKGIRATYSKLEPPSMDEGFDELYSVRIISDNAFETILWDNEIR